MTTPQEPAKRKKQKARRTKQLAEWRAKKAASGETAKKDAKKTAT